MKTMIIKYKPFLFYLLAVIFFLFPFSGIQAQNEIGINTASPKSDFEVNGSFAKKTVTVTASTTLNETHNIVICNNDATAITITLPAVAGCTGRIYTIKKRDVNEATVTLDGNASETIDGVATLDLSDPLVAATLISNGTEWKIIGDKPEPFPVGEISYFDVATGTTANVTAQSNGSTNMVVCSPTTSFTQQGTEFEMSANGRLRYIGTTTKTFHIACTISMKSANNNNTFVFGLAKSGTIKGASKILNRLSTSSRQSTALHLMETLSYGQYLELYVGNLTNTDDAKIYSLNIVAIGML